MYQRSHFVDDGGENLYFTKTRQWAMNCGIQCGQTQNTKLAPSGFKHLLVNVKNLGEG